MEEVLNVYARQLAAARLLWDHQHVSLIQYWTLVRRISKSAAKNGYLVQETPDRLIVTKLGKRGNRR